MDESSYENIRSAKRANPKRKQRQSSALGKNVDWVC